MFLLLLKSLDYLVEVLPFNNVLGRVLNQNSNLVSIINGIVNVLFSAPIREATSSRFDMSFHIDVIAL